MLCGGSCQRLSVYARQRKMKLCAGFLLLVAVVGVGTALAKVTVEKPPELQVDPVTQREKTPKLAHVVFRHGQRTPADTYPNDVYSNHTFHPYGWGQLTNEGRMNQFKLGQFLRQRYDSLLGKLFSTSAVFAQSTQTDRAFMSAALTLAGIWPTKGTELEWSKELNWSPAPIISQPLNEDTLLLARKNCPRYFEELENVLKLPEIAELMQDNDALFKELTEKTGLSIKDPDDVQSLYSTLKAEEDFGLQLPEWTKAYYPGKLVPLTEESFIINAYNQELKRIKGGPLLKKLISDWSAKAAGALKPDRKLFVYAGHDSTVANLMIALGAWEKQIPTYGITVLLELYEDDDTKEYGVEIFLRNSTKTEPTQVTIPGCTPHCPLNKLIELTKDVVPINWTEDCKAKDPNYVAPAPGGP